jgi:NADPH2:quinone reductase
MMRDGQSVLGRLVIGLIKPRKKFRIPGLELAGQVESVGKDVKRFRVGDQVFGFTGFEPGAYAEYKCMSEKASLAIKPPRMTYEEAAAAVDAATTALFFLKDKGHIRRGHQVLIYGASGSIGTFAVQLAKHFGAEVTAVCSGANRDLVKSLGADKVIDYTQEDFTKTGDTYHIIFDTVGKTRFSRCKGCLQQHGRYLVTVMGWGPVIQTLWTGVAGKKKSIYAMSIDKTEALTYLYALIENGSIKSVIDRRYRLEQIADAHRYVSQGHKKGNVVITV